ncbi:16S rRNA (uracil(1498)-N(3))-methyltransferase [bacterium LRH843]|nr:16S rRNA (uracil(1498)-N(3))-methyltransferase [bacterium LRH843]
MQRYFVREDQIGENVVTITGDDVKHIGRVMRMQPGNEIICSDGESRTVRCKLTDIAADCVQAEILEELAPNTELPIHVTIAQGLPKGDKLELIVQKGTELGAIRFIPFAATRSVTKWDHKKSEKKIERLMKISKEAAEQSYRERVPAVANSLSVTELSKQLSSFDAVIVAFEESAKDKEQTNFAKTLQSLHPGQTLLVIIGPEGGLSEIEIEAFTKEGAVLCGFGPRILRTETAPLYALSAISYQFELMR